MLATRATAAAAHRVARATARMTLWPTAVVGLRGLYLYGSLTTGDFSPASSDIDVLAVTERQPDEAALHRLSALHLDLARGGGAYARLNCLYVPDGTLADPARLHTYW
jgi:predicted nucleotidyltransferase